MSNRIEILDQDDRLSIGFDDLTKYHGRSSVGGLAIGFKMLQRGLAHLSPGAPPRRGDFQMLTAFPGPGARDAIEMVTRAVTAGRYTVDVDLALPPGVPEAPRGRYFFRLGYGRDRADLAIRPGLVRPEFVALIRRKAETCLDESDEARLVALKRELADRLLALPAEAVFDVLA